MPRGVNLNLLASALTIMAAIALLATASVVGDASVVEPVPGRHDAVIREFYSAVNEVFRTGDTAALDSVVDLDLVFHTPSPRITPTRAGLERFLTSIHASFPDFQLQIEDIVGDGDQAMARVVGESAEPGDYLGLSFAALPAAWGQFDVFRVENDRIVELRVGAPAPVVLEPAARINLDTHTQVQALSMERLSARQGEGREWGPLFDSRVLYVDEGAMTIVVNHASSPALHYANRGGRARPVAAAPETPVTVTAGEAVSFPPGSNYTFRHDSTDSDVVAFAVVLSRFNYDGPLLPPRSPETEDETQENPALRVVHTAGIGNALPEMLSAAAVSFGHAHIPPGLGSAFREGEGYTFVAVESGTLMLQDEHDATSLKRVDQGAATLVMPNAPFAWHNLGDTPVAAMVVVVSSDALPERLP